jgi:hypothetical protein
MAIIGSRLSPPFYLIKKGSWLPNIAISELRLTALVLVSPSEVYLCYRERNVARTCTVGAALMRGCEELNSSRIQFLDARSGGCLRERWSRARLCAKRCCSQSESR